MKIKRVEMIWNNQFANKVDVKFIVDEYPKFDFIFNKIVVDDKSYYFSEPIDGFVGFAVHDPKREQGYGGREFEFPLTDGTIDVRKGVWSSRGEEMVEVGFKSANTISLLKEGDYCGISVNILSSKLADILREYVPEVVFQFTLDGIIEIPKDQPANVR